MASDALAPYGLTPHDVADVVERLRSVRDAFRAAKTAVQQDALLDKLSVVVELPVCGEYDAGAASHYEIDATTWSPECAKFMNFVRESGLDLNLLGWDAPVEDAVWKQTVSYNNRHLVTNDLANAGILGCAIVDARRYVRTPAILAAGAGGDDPSGCGPTRAHAYESARGTPDGFAPRDRMHAHVDGEHVRGTQRGAVRLRDQSIVLSTLGAVYMTARHVERSKIEDAASFERGGFSVFTMTQRARELVKHAVVADPNGLGGVSLVSNFVGTSDVIHASARRALFADWTTTLLVCGDIVRLEGADFVERVEFRAAPREVLNLKTDNQRLRSVYGGLKARDMGVGIHAVDEEGVHFQAVKGGIAARDARVGVHGLSEAERKENGKKGGEAARDALSGFHAVDADGKKYVAAKGGAASAAKHMKNATGIYGRTAEQHSADSAVGGTRSMITIWRRFAAENARRIRTIFVYAEFEDEIREYCVEVIADKISAPGAITLLYYRFRCAKSTFATLADIIESHVTDEVARRLCASDVGDIGEVKKCGKSVKKYAKLHVPETNATRWNDEEYRREAKFAVKFKFLSRLCRHVVFRESEHDAYETVVDDAS